MPLCSLRPDNRCFSDLSCVSLVLARETDAKVHISAMCASEKWMENETREEDEKPFSS